MNHMIHIHYQIRVAFVALVICLFVPFWIIHNISYSDQLILSNEGIHVESDPGDSFCVAVLTGYPEVAREFYIRRLLNILKHQVELPTRRLNLNVFCQGDCDIDIGQEFNGHFHNLNTLVSGKRHRRKQPKLMERYGQFLCKNGCDIQHEIKDSIVLEQEKALVFNKNRWFFLSENYKIMFDYLFESANVSHCAIFEDDLIISPDSLMYLHEGVQIMQQDSSIFTISLNNDNSYPMYASDPTFFRRVGYFAGLGFILTQKHYLDLIKPSWRINRNWDTIVQKVVVGHNMVSIQPEVTRSAHIRSRDITSLGRVPPRDVFESQLLNEMTHPRWNLSILAKERYNQFIYSFISNGIIIDYLEDALFYNKSDKLLFIKCLDFHQLDAMLQERHLIGAGNGGIIRGAYNGSLFLRMTGVQVLIMCQSSTLYKTHRKVIQLRKDQGNSTEAMISNVSTNNNITNRRVHRSLLGVIYRLQRDYNVIVGYLNRSCDDVCKQTSGYCDRVGLWLLNRDCSVAQRCCSECGSCRGQVGIRPYVGYYPAMDSDSIVHLSFPHYLNCQMAAETHRRICPCMQNNKLSKHRTTLFGDFK